MTDQPSDSTTTDTWDGILDALRRRYPGQKDSVLFCIYKLQQNPDLSLRDFREEAALYGIPMAGRALHSARGLLGLSQPAPRASGAGRSSSGRSSMGRISEGLAFGGDDGDGASERAGRAGRRRQRTADARGEESIEDKVLSAVRHIQSAAGADAERLRAAMRQAIATLQRALGE